MRLFVLTSFMIFSTMIIATGQLVASETPPGEEAGHVHAHGHESGDEIEEVVVQATRTGRRLEDEPVRVEVIVGEEIEEKLLMRPGNIAMLVSETPGVRVQVTSPALGSANIRMQGLRGRYTQLLSDGLPLYGGQVPSLGLLQIPPTDLGQVEIIKGAASALYGPSALGGVINLGSRRLGEDRESEFLLNLTSRNAQDLTAYTSNPVNDNWGYSLVAGANQQHEQDLDGDGWIDMPEYQRATFRPRVFWEGDSGATAYLTLGAAVEDRIGGTLPGATVPDGQPFPQTQDTTRFDLGLLASKPLNDLLTLQFRAAGMSQDDEHRYGDSIEPDH
ncbi:MAG TPA: TonB-dependent receptor plug domain-containing protein, partial [Xanthomonadales bacterium]|nr:TonB-dependent receptor plug domain-containing protein [Xanthomonadales bacterium]